MKIKLLILAILLSAVNIAMAYTITGTVTSNGEPLIGALVTRIEGNDVAHAITNIDGLYTVESVTKDNVMLTASYVSHKTEIKTVDSAVVNFDLEEIPEVPVELFMTLLENSALIELTTSAQLQSIGAKDLDLRIFLSGNNLVFSLQTPRRSVSDFNFNVFPTTTIKGYLQQLKSEGNLDTFLTQMQASGMKWVFGVYSTSADKWLEYKEYDAKQIRKLL